MGDQIADIFRSGIQLGTQVWQGGQMEQERRRRIQAEEADRAERERATKAKETIARETIASREAEAERQRKWSGEQARIAFAEHWDEITSEQEITIAGMIEDNRRYDERMTHILKPQIQMQIRLANQSLLEGAQRIRKAKSEAEVQEILEGYADQMASVQYSLQYEEWKKMNVDRVYAEDTLEARKQADLEALESKAAYEEFRQALLAYERKNGIIPALGYARIAEARMSPIKTVAAINASVTEASATMLGVGVAQRQADAAQTQADATMIRATEFVANGKYVRQRMQALEKMDLDNLDEMGIDQLLTIQGKMAEVKGGVLKQIMTLEEFRMQGGKPDLAGNPGPIIQYAPGEPEYLVDPATGRRLLKGGQPIRKQTPEFTRYQEMMNPFLTDLTRIRVLEQKINENLPAGLKAELPAFATELPEGITVEGAPPSPTSAKPRRTAWEILSEMGSSYGQRVPGAPY